MGNASPSTIAQVYLSACERHSDRTAFRYIAGHPYDSVTYGELITRSLAFASSLLSMGIHRGDRILMLSENRPEWAIADFAMALIGAVNVPVHSVLSAEQVAEIIEDSDPRAAIVSTAEMAERLSAGYTEHMSGRVVVTFDDRVESPTIDSLVRFSTLADGASLDDEASDGILRSGRAIGPDDLMSITFTSGTTGRQKGVMLTHGNLTSNMVAGLKLIPYGADDRFISVLPLSHVYERIAGFYAVLASGASIHYIEGADQLVPTAKAWKPTAIVAVPRLFEKVQETARARAGASRIKGRIFEWAFDPNVADLPVLSSLFERLVYSPIRASLGGECRYAVLGGAKVPLAVSSFFERVGIPLLEGYGLTETSPIVSTNGPKDYGYGTVGRILDGVKVRFADDGEIEVYGAGVMQGYVRDEDMVDVFTEDGWLKTGDLGRMDEDGRLVLTGRKKDIIVLTTGKKVAPTGIEEALTSSAFISQACVVGDARKHISAVLVPDMDALAREFGRVTPECMTEGGRAHRLVREEAARVTARLSSVEQIRSFIIAERPFTLEDDLVTPTLKMKRRCIHERYQAEIEGLYV